MSLTNLSLLSNVVHGVPSGNYNGTSLNFDSNSVPAVNYYAGQGAIQTIAITLAGFTGNIKLQGSLNDTSTPLTWFDAVDTAGNTTQSYGNTTGTTSLTYLGNFAWMRVNITDFSAGNISNVVISY